MLCGPPPSTPVRADIEATPQPRDEVRLAVPKSRKLRENLRERTALSPTARTDLPERPSLALPTAARIEPPGAHRRSSRLSPPWRVSNGPCGCRKLGFG